MKRQLYITLLALLTCYTLLAQSKPKMPDYIISDKRIYYEAKFKFDNANYSEALKLLDNAKKARRDKVTWEVYTLKNSFKPYEVKAKGDKLLDIIPVLQERNDYDALGIIERYSKYYGEESYKGSATRLISFIESQDVFPEAEYLSGKIYEIEGEYNTAEELYLLAYKRADLLEIPDERFDILYSLANIAMLKEDNKKYEDYLVLIMSQGHEYKNKTYLTSLRRSIRSKSKNCVDKFFSMYRSTDYRLLKASFLLADYYETYGQQERALDTIALGCLIGFTKIYHIAQKRNADFNFEGFSTLLKEVWQYEDIILWGSENGLWRAFSTLAKYSLANGGQVFGKTMFSILQEASPEERLRLEAAVMYEALNKDAGNDTLNTDNKEVTINIR